MIGKFQRIINVVEITRDTDSGDVQDM